MAEFDHGVKLIVSSAGRELARMAGLACRGWQPLESTVQATTELLADRVFRARQGRQRFVVYFEFYTTWDAAAPWNLLAKAGLLSQRERLPTVCLVFVLLPRGYRPQGGQFRLEAAGGPTQQLWFHEVPLWEQTPQSWWEEAPTLMPLYPLCRHGRVPRQAIEHAAAVIRARVPDRPEQADTLALLSIFSDLADMYRGYATLQGYVDSGAPVVPGHDPSVMNRFAPLDGDAAGLAVCLTDLRSE